MREKKIFVLIFNFNNAFSPDFHGGKANSERKHEYYW